MIQNHLDKYAKDHDLLHRIRFNSWVDKAERCPRGWRLTPKGSGDVVETEKLLVATGVTSVPNMPGFGASSASIPNIHLKDLGALVPKLESNFFRTMSLLAPLNLHMMRFICSSR